MDALQEMRTLLTVARAGSLSAAARDMQLSVAMVSKRMDALEQRLGVRLLLRTTRHCSLTPEGLLYVQDCRRILDDLQEAEAAISREVHTVQGVVRVTATFGFGRRVLAPLLAQFAQGHPEVQVQLGLSDALSDVQGGHYDVAIRLAPLPDSRLVSQRLVRNRRLVVAAPSYLAQHGIPVHPQALLQHNCIVLQGSSDALLSWQFQMPKGTTLDIPVRGNLVTDNGDIQRSWALLGVGLSLKSVWDVADDLQSGRLQAVLSDYPCPDADIYAVYRERHFQPARVQHLVSWLREQLQSREADVLALLH